MRTNVKPAFTGLKIPALPVAAWAVMLCLAPASRAAYINWIGGAADYTNTANWTSGSVPTPSDDAINDHGTNNIVLINSGDPDWAVYDIRAGNGTGDGAWVQNARTVTVNAWFRLGIAPTNTGIYTLNGGSLVVNSGEFHVGEQGTGIFNMGGGQISGSGTLAVNFGDVFEGVGPLTTNICFFNKTNGAVAITGQFIVGNRGTGIGNLMGGTMDVANNVIIGRSSGSGILTISGGTLNQNASGQNFVVGSGYQNNGTPATGLLNQSGGSISCAGQFLCPDGAPASGTYNLSGTGSLSVSNWIMIGRGGAMGTLNISGGSITKTGTAANHLDIGAGGVGTFNQTGGTITNISSDTWIGESTNGTWNLNGGSAVLASVILGVNARATGTLNINGGTLTATRITAGAGTNNSLSINGGTIRAETNAVNLIYGLTQATIGAGGATFDSGTKNVIISQALLDNGGGLIKVGSGTLTLTGVNTYRGNNTISAGKLILGTYSTGGGSVAVANGAGLGMIVESANGQLTAPTTTLGTSSAVSLDFDLGPFGNPLSAPLNVTGALAVNGTVTVNILSNSVLQVGQFPLIKYGSRTGTGSFILGKLPWGAQAGLVTNIANSSIDLIVSTPPRSEIVSANFDGPAAAGWVWPDANAAVGPNHIVSWGNNSVAIFDKYGKQISSQDATGFFGFPASGAGHVIYDEITGRFALEVLSTNHSVGFAVSDTGDPAGSWHKINIGVPGLTNGYAANGIGYNADAYVVHLSAFTNYYAVIAASNNANLAYTLQSAPANVRLGSPVCMPATATGAPFYFVAGNDDGASGQGGTLGNIEVVKVTNILGASPTYTDYQVAATTGEASVANVSWRNNLLAVVGSTGTPATVTWYLLGTTNAPLLLQGGIITPENGGDANVPSIAVSPNGSLAVNYTAAFAAPNGTNLTAMYVAGRTSTDAVGLMRAPRLIVSGPTTDGRWGSYSSCVVDVNAAGAPQNSFWACNEYLATPGQANWRERIASFSMPAPSSISVAGSLYVDLRAGDLVTGVATWTNRTGVGNFNRDGTDAPVFGSYEGFWAVQLDGTDGFKGPNTTAVQLSTNLPRTIEAWVNLPVLAADETVVALGARGTNNHNFAFNYGTDPALGALEMQGNDLGWNSVPMAGSWHYLATTFDGTNLLIYRDGILDNAATRAAATPVGPIWIGSQTADAVNPSTAWLSGYLNNVRIHTGVLSRDQIAANYVIGPATLTAPAAPTGVAVTTSNSQNNVHWNPSFDATGYNLKRSTNSGGPFTLLDRLTVTNFTDVALTNGYTYYYVVSATNVVGEGANSSAVGVAMPKPVLTAGTMLTNGQFTLSFKGASNQTFVVEISTNLASWTPLATNSGLGSLYFFTDTNALTRARFYRIRY